MRSDREERETVYNLEKRARERFYNIVQKIILHAIQAFHFPHTVIKWTSRTYSLRHDALCVLCSLFTYNWFSSSQGGPLGVQFPAVWRTHSRKTRYFKNQPGHIFLFQDNKDIFRSIPGEGRNSRTFQDHVNHSMSQALHVSFEHVLYCICCNAEMIFPS